MGAKVIILAKSLIPNFLRACAIVHWLSNILSQESLSKNHQVERKKEKSLISIIRHCTMAQALKKFGIKDFAKMMTLAPIFSRQNYFR